MSWILVSTSKGTMVKTARSDDHLEEKYPVGGPLTKVFESIISVGILYLHRCS